MTKQKFSLKMLRLRDLEHLAKWRHSDHMKKFLHDEGSAPDACEVKDWVQSSIGNPLIRMFYHEGVPVGIVVYSELQEENGVCEMSFYAADSDMTLRLIEAALDHAFQSLKVRKVCVSVTGENEERLSLLKKSGFQQEGCFKKQIKRNDYVDVTTHALFAQKWPKVKSGLFPSDPFTHS